MTLNEILKGKAREDLETWYIKNLEYKAGMCENSFMKLPIEFQFGVIQDWASKDNIDVTIITNWSKTKGGKSMTKTYRVGFVWVDNQNVIQTKFIRPEDSEHEFIEFEDLDKAFDAAVKQLVETYNNKKA